MIVKQAIIRVNEDLLESFDQLMHCGSKGIHPLFSNWMIRDAFEQQLSSLEANHLQRVQEILNDLVSIPDLEEQRDYVEGLDRHLRNLLIQIYFDFLDRFSSEESSQETLH